MVLLRYVAGLGYTGIHSNYLQTDGTTEPLVCIVMRQVAEALSAMPA